MSGAWNDIAEARLRGGAARLEAGRHRGPAAPDSPDNSEIPAHGRHRKAAAPRQEA